METVSVRQFIDSMVGTIGFDDLFAWPPDVFAVTSAILKRTGAYRYVVCPPGDEKWPPRLATSPDTGTWTTATSRLAEEWIRSICEISAPPPWIVEQRDRVRRDWEKVSLEALSDVDDHGSAWPLCCALLALHSVADSACRGFGTPAAPQDTGVAQFLADHLLACYGSLSRLPKSLGIVLPKMRTPQRGLTLRATSLYATWHETEVKAVWRAVPWVNSEENTLNVLVIPWPDRVDARSFRSTPPAGLRTIGTHRYFAYAPPDSLRPEHVLGLLKRSEEVANRVHLLVLPELALSHRELRELQSALASVSDPTRVPLVVAGVRDWEDADPWVGEAAGPCNCVVLSMYVAGKWYHLRQGKHHRWRLDRRQVRQYGVGGMLASDRDWWEHVHVPPRQLAVLAPTGWLALCPLICEDLAQLEPVSEIIRGVGPTLLATILFDGPQLATRWSAKYASVMADDPGTAVLTVTSRGMARRSEPLDPCAKRSTDAVASWRDAEGGFRELPLADEDDGLLVTLSALWKEEFSADGRSDGGNAATFVLTGVQPLRLKGAAGDCAASASARSIPWKGAEPSDLYDLTTFVQLVDAALDAAEPDRRLILAIARQRGLQTRRECSPDGAAVVRLIEAVEHADRSVDRRSDPPLDGESELGDAIDYFETLLDRRDQAVVPDGCPEADPRRPAGVRRWAEDVKRVDRRLKDAAATPAGGLSRTQGVVLHVVLWAIYNRLEHLRRTGQLDCEGAEIMREIEALLARSVQVAELGAPA